MRSCENCGAELEPDDVACPVCSAALDLQLHIDESRPKWSEKIDEYVCSHWLAQSQRRLTFPVDETEEIPYVAFEYGWKVVNRLYNELKVPKQIDPKTGKKRRPTAKESMVYLLQHFGVTDAIIDENRGYIEGLCDCVLETPDPTRMQGKRGSVTFDEPSGESLEDESAGKTTQMKIRRPLSQSAQRCVTC
jgi:hypothetical protein